ncbi:MAG: hypothetical protein KDC98_04820, partial [Planctomycetes bacterium]|nr:hypothetical protein [Planctomycetota bacterium]
MNRHTLRASGLLGAPPLLRLCTALAVALPVAAQGGVVAFGLPHAPLGAASLAVGSAGDLTVAGIGSSGQDGVEIALGNSHGWDGWFTPTQLQTNSSIEYTFIGSGPLVTHMPGSGMRVTRQGSDHLLEVG